MLGGKLWFWYCTGAGMAEWKQNTPGIRAKRAGMFRNETLQMNVIWILVMFVVTVTTRCFWVGNYVHVRVWPLHISCPPPLLWNIVGAMQVKPAWSQKDKADMLRNNSLSVIFISLQAEAFCHCTLNWNQILSMPFVVASVFLWRGQCFRRVTSLCGKTTCVLGSILQYIVKKECTCRLDHVYHTTAHPYQY